MCGVYLYVYLRLLNLQLELQRMVETAYVIDDMPSAVRFPRAQGLGAEVLADLFGDEMPEGEMPKRAAPLAIGKGRVVKRGGAAAAVRPPCFIDEHNFSILALLFNIVALSIRASERKNIALLFFPLELGWRTR